MNEKNLPDDIDLKSLKELTETANNRVNIFHFRFIPETAK